MSCPQKKHINNFSPLERKVYLCVKKNDLQGLCQIMDPLTLEQRRKLGTVAVDDKTPLFFASKLGSKEMIKYLVVECGVEVNSGCAMKQASRVPMFAATMAGHLDAVRTLLKLRADVDWRDEAGVKCIFKACSYGYYWLAKYFQLHGADINCDLNVDFCSRTKRYCQLSLKVGADLDFQDKDGRTALMYATASGRYDVVNFLLSCKIDKYKRDHSGLNALCISILNNQQQMLKHLLTFVYARNDYILALEFCGAHLLLFNMHQETALGYWKLALVYRHENMRQFDNKIKPGDLGSPFERGEFQSEAEVDNLIKDRRERSLQILLIYCRILSLDHTTTHDAFYHVVSSNEFRNDLTTAFRMIDLIFRFYTGRTSPFNSVAEKAITNTVDLFETNKDTLDLSNASHILSRFDIAFDFLKTHIWKELRDGEYSDLNFSFYYEFLQKMLDFIKLILNFSLTKEQEEKFRHQIKVIGQVYIDRYPISLLHIAVECGISDTVLSYILNCDVEVNFQDSTRSTPLHLLLENSFAMVRSKIRLFVDAGSHLDAMNMFEYCPLSVLQAHKMIIKKLEFTSLQCLAARVIRRSHIFLPDESYPKHLRDFIALH